MASALGRRAVVAALVAGGLLVAGCGTGGGDGGRTAPAPPDALTLTLEPEGGPAFRIALDCAVADRSACAKVLEAMAEERDSESCAPIASTGERIIVRGTIEGRQVGAAIERRTDCEARLYDRVRAALAP
jgi:hypothetical protein